MQLRFGVIAIAIVLSSTSARAQENTVSEAERVEWGVGVKVRRAYITPALQHLFYEDSPGTSTMDGAGIDFARRKGTVEVVFGVGYDVLHAEDGFYLEKGASPLVTGKVDYVQFSHPRWWTGEITVINHVQLHALLEFRYGAGLGLGIVRGKIYKTDAICTGGALQSECTTDPAGADQHREADIPPVLPVINAIVGLQFRPLQRVQIHVDVGLHTVPHISAGVKMYLW